MKCHLASICRRRVRRNACLDEYSVSAASATATAEDIDPLDWPYWRGPEYNSITRETGLPDTINPDGRREAATCSGSGTTSAAAARRSCCAASSTRSCAPIRRTPNEGEKVVCLDAATGKTIWESRHNVWSSDVPDTRVGWSSVVGDPETGNVYALGACGLFECLDGDTGKIVWSIPLHEQFGLLTTYGGRTNFPIIFDDLVILGSVIIGWGDMAVPAHRFIGFDKATGRDRLVRQHPRSARRTRSTARPIAGHRSTARSC